METFFTILRTILKFIFVWIIISLTLSCMKYWLVESFSIYWVAAYIFSFLPFYFGIDGIIKFVNKLIKQ